MADPGSDPGELLNYVNNALTHKGNLKAALDYHSVRDPDLELISTEGRRLFGHRFVTKIAICYYHSSATYDSLSLSQCILFFCRRYVSLKHYTLAPNAMTTLSKEIK